jgi:hypothetical protein
MSRQDRHHIQAYSFRVSFMDWELWRVLGYDTALSGT